MEAGLTGSTISNSSRSSSPKPSKRRQREQKPSERWSDKAREELRKRFLAAAAKDQNKKPQHWLQRLSSYVPLHLQKRALEFKRNEPRCEVTQGVVLFADISGFTALTEQLTRKGPEGVEQLTKVLNTYFGTIISIIHSFGGDLIHFAGDAVLALWCFDDRAPPPPSSVLSARRPSHVLGRLGDADAHSPNEFTHAAPSPSVDAPLLTPAAAHSSLAAARAGLAASSAAAASKASIVVNGKTLLPFQEETYGWHNTQEDSEHELMAARARSGVQVENLDGVSTAAPSAPAVNIASATDSAANSDNEGSGPIPTEKEKERPMNAAMVEELRRLTHMAAQCALYLMEQLENFTVDIASNEPAKASSGVPLPPGGPQPLGLGSPSKTLASNPSQTGLTGGKEEVVSGSPSGGGLLSGLAEQEAKKG